MTYQQSRGRDLAPASQPQMPSSSVALGSITTAGGVSIVPQSLGEVMEFARMMAMSRTAVRKHLRENPGACFAVAMQAFRWGMDPYAVASKSFEVNDQIAYEAQLIAAVINKNAPIKDRPTYEYSGDGPSRRCKVTVETTTGQRLSYESPPKSQIKPQNSPLWTSDPDQQLAYYAVRALARRHFPDILMGVYDPEEAESMTDVTPRSAEPAAAAVAAPTKTKAAAALDAFATRPAAAPVQGAHVIEEQPIRSAVVDDEIPEGRWQEEAQQASEPAGDEQPDENGVFPDSDEQAAVSIPEMPAAAEQAWQTSKKWGAAWKWLRAQDGQPQPVLMHLALTHEDILSAVAAYNDDARLAVEDYRRKAGMA